jgi:hypothetical protein
MLRSFFKKSLLFLVGAFALLPNVAGATDTTYNFLFDTGWTSPLQTTTYPLGTAIHVSGPWKLPSEWRGNIYVYQDGIQVTGAYTITYPTKTITGSGSIVPITNQGGGTEIVGTFDLDIGPQTSGSHQIYVSFTGGTTCAINSIPPVVSPSCPIDTFDPDINFMSSKGWLLSGSVAQPTYTVGPPSFPVMAVTPDPTLDFGDVSGQTDRSFTITNTGGEVLSGQISGIAAPFYCATSCLYSVPPGSSLPLTIRFAPTGASQSYSASVSLSCIGATKSCQPLSSYARTIKANFTNTAQPPQVSLCATPPCSINFGNVNTLVSSTKSVTVTNTGGGKLDGTITFSSPEYTCVGSCDYHLWGGESVVIQVKFTPVSAVPAVRNDTATFTGGVSQNLSMTSVVNDKPILMVYNKLPTDPIYTANWGDVISNTCSGWGFSVNNVGAGMLSNVGLPITGSPLAIPTALASAKTPGFSCVRGCTYSGLTSTSLVHYVTIQYCATGAYDDGALHSTTAEFKNTQGASVFLRLTAQSNNLPFADFSGASSGNTGFFLAYSDSPLLNFGNVLLNTTKTLDITMENTGAGTLMGMLGAPTDPAFQCISAKTLPSAAITTCAVPYSIPNDGTTVTFTYAFRPTIQKNYEATVDMGYGNMLTLRGRGALPSFEFETDLDPSQTNTVNRSLSSPSGVVSLQSTNDADNLYYKVSYAMANPPYVDVYTNGDQDSGTGYNPRGLAGADYLMESYTIFGSSYGDLYRYIGTGGGWGWQYIKDVTYADIGTTEKDFTISRADLGYPRYIGALANLEDTVVNKSSYTTTLIHTFSQSLTPFNSAANAFDFGATLYGSVSQNKRLRFIAINRAQVGTVSYSIDVSSAPNFLCVSSCSSAALNAPNYTFPVIEFHPLAVGDYIEPITVTYDLNDGTGVHSTTFYAHGNSNLISAGSNVSLIRIVPDSYLDMSIVAQGARRDRDVTIYNDGALPLNVTRIWASVVGDFLTFSTHFACLADAYTAPDNCNPTIPAGGSRIIKVTFQPQTGSGDLYADLNFLSDAFNGPTPPIQLHGVATVSSIVTILLQGSDFGRVTVNKTKVQDVTIQNTGSGDFGSGSLTFTGPFKCIASEYGLDGSGNCKYTLNAGGSTTITIEFAPKTTGPLIGTLELSGLAGVALPPLTGIGSSPYIIFIET